jgi:hypothetical protein
VTRCPYAPKSHAQRRDGIRRAQRAKTTRIRAARVATDASGRAPRAECARASVAVRKTARAVHEYPCAKKVTLTPRRAASPAPRRRADANLGVPRPGYTRVTWPHASPVARGARCPRAPARVFRLRSAESAARQRLILRSTPVILLSVGLIIQQARDTLRTCNAGLGCDVTLLFPSE